VLWKNGEAISLESRRGEGISLAVSGDDVYVVVQESIQDTTGRGVITTKLWKNGSLSTLGSEGDDFRGESIAISGKDVYIAGMTYNRKKEKSIATVFTNDISSFLTDGTNNTKAISIAVFGQNIYVVGESTPKGETFGYARMWKNGVVTSLSNKESQATSVFVDGPKAMASAPDQSAASSSTITVPAALHQRMCEDSFESYAQAFGGNSSIHYKLLEELKPEHLKVLGTLPLRVDGGPVYLIQIKDSFNLFDEKGSGILRGIDWLDSKDIKILPEILGGHHSFSLGGSIYRFSDGSYDLR
jgi:hypothetical protein